jgi:vancomycin resistance protein YoaR
MERNMNRVKQGVTIENVKVEGLLPGELRGVLEEMTLRHQRLPVEPRMDKETGRIITESEGISVDVEKTLVQILLAAPGQENKLEIVTSLPRYKSQDLIDARNRIASYSTWFQGTSQRHQNISVALNSINNIVIWPREIFSFNEITGPRTAERGYLPAPIILNGGYDVDYGGGVCQVSSTVYNAVLMAGLPVIERHGHSKPVHYVLEGKDATVDYGYLDLKFQNNQDGPIIVKSSINNSRIYVEFRGEK